MTLYGPFTAQNFLRQLKRLAGGPPDRAFFEGILDAVVDTFEAERGFVLTVREDQSLQVVAARNLEARSISRSLDGISHHAIRLAMCSADGLHHTHRAHLDRRYRTEESCHGRRRPVSVLAFVVPVDDGQDMVVYLDHRFQTLEINSHRRLLVDHWFALLQVGTSIRDRQRELRRHERRAGKAAPQPAHEEGSRPEPVEPLEFYGLWTSSALMIELFEMVSRLRSSDIPVLITGETGTGKSVLAAAFHRSRRRIDGPFLSVNCGALPDALLESELFGHVQGAFTGADTSRDGLLLQADGGTLFLDEIGDMSPEMQKKLLGFLENGRFRPLGSSQWRQADVRLLSSTRVPLLREIDRGRFRMDLYYRLCGIHVELPPLRNRREDVVGLAERFLHRYAAEIDVPCPRLKDAGKRWLLRNPWPGNVRQLANLMRQVTVLGYDVVDAVTLKAIVRREGGPVLDSPDSRTIEAVVATAEREAIERALGQSAGNKSRAAGLLGITRKSLYRRLTKYRLFDSEGVEEMSVGRNVR